MKATKVLKILELYGLDQVTEYSHVDLMDLDNVKLELGMLEHLTSLLRYKVLIHLQGKAYNKIY